MKNKINYLTLTVEIQNQGDEYVMYNLSISLVVNIVMTKFRCRL